MTWTNILVPVLGSTSDAQTLSVAKALAAPFDATISVVFASPSASGLFNWAIEGGFGVTDVAVAAIQEETERGRARCGEFLTALDYTKTSFEAVTADDWLELRAATRLADVVVWERSAADGHGFFASAFQQILLDERRPAFIADRPPQLEGTIVVAWDGGREASRALRRSVPLLKKADRVVILTVPHAMARPCDGERAVQYLDDQGVRASIDVMDTRGDASPAILDVRKMDANILVAGAFGHPRLQRSSLAARRNIYWRAGSVPLCSCRTEESYHLDR